MSITIFSKIINKEIPAKIVYEDEEILAFEDINPIAPVHILFIPKKHIESLDSISEEDAALVGRIFWRISEYAHKHELHEQGYRIINNTGKYAGQSVFHIHFHLLAGREFAWPPG